MQEQWDVVQQRGTGGEPFAIARVVSTFGSSPRPAGAAMVVSQDGTVSGSLSGGCVEAAVYELAHQAMTTGLASLHRFGVTDDDAFAVGLTCGGTIDVFVQPVTSSSSPELAHLWSAVREQRPVALATVVRHHDQSIVGRHVVVGESSSHGDVGSNRLLTAITDDARGVLSQGANRTLHYGVDGRRIGQDVTVFVESFTSRPRMIVFGAIDFAAAVAHVGSFLGFQVTVCDARPVFATATRFPSADEVVVAWPHRYVQQEVDAGRLDARTVVCVLTHEAKFDIPLLTTLLELPDTVRPRFIGAMGSRRTHERRHDALLAAGVEKARLEMLRSPIGLDLGARTPEETAISIVAEIIADRWGGTGTSLSEGTTPIHHGPTPVRAAATCQRQHERGIPQARDRIPNYPVTPSILR
ncbi:XdhC family protein [Micromonospora sp. NPDC048830]|uniref:XdhC family protein n=1 Tax=Micromonospora sp. NPDC048830 TaxID=3364257 RepID=UPI00371B1999